MADEQVPMNMITLRLQQNGEEEKLASEEHVVARRHLLSEKEGRQMMLQIFGTRLPPLNVDLILQRARYYVSASRPLARLYLYVIYDKDVIGGGFVCFFRKTVAGGSWKHSLFIRKVAAKYRRLRKVEAGGCSTQSLSFCDICLRRFSGGSDDMASALPCSHVYHRRCISRWLARSSSCPTCRRRVLIAEASCITNFFRICSRVFGFGRWMNFLSKSIRQ